MSRTKQLLLAVAQDQQAHMMDGLSRTFHEMAYVLHGSDRLALFQRVQRLRAHFPVIPEDFVYEEVSMIGHGVSAVLTHWPDIPLLGMNGERVRQPLPFDVAVWSMLMYGDPQVDARDTQSVMAALVRLHRDCNSYAYAQNLLAGHGFV